MIYYSTRHFERQCQKELEDEGDEFADKESFVTSSYKNKLAVSEISIYLGVGVW